MRANTAYPSDSRMQAMDWTAWKRRGSASICEGVVPSEIACTRVIDWIHAGVRIAWTAMKAARSSRSLRARRISITPKTTAVRTVRAVAIFATEERFTAAICSNTLFDVTQIWSYARERDKTVSQPCRLSLERPRDQSYANRPCLRNKHGRERPA